MSQAVRGGCDHDRPATLSSYRVLVANCSNGVHRKGSQEMTTTTMERRSLFTALVGEPLDLIKAQPPQLLISMASAYLIGAEAAVLFDAPFNIFLAVGAEWGYLRGMASAAGIDTKWKDRLTYANGALVVLYGALFSLRQFGALPAVEAYHNHTAQTGTVGAIIMTIIHIACIGAVTVCAMMAHAAMLSEEARVKRLADKQVAERDERNRATEDARRLRWQEAQDAIELDRRQKEAALKIEEAEARQRMQLAAERAQLRSATRTQPQAQPKIIYDGVEYPTVQAAADAVGISRQAMSKRLKKG